MALILNEKNQLLVTRRKQDPFKGTLDLPGGFAEPGEGIEQSLIREIKEELEIHHQEVAKCIFPPELKEPLNYDKTLTLPAIGLG